MEGKAGVVSTHVSRLDDHVDDIRLVFEKVNDTKRVDEERKAEETLRASFSGKGLEIMVSGSGQHASFCSTHSAQKTVRWR